jgi:threonylcarbamoyladenosine tRNA methylthiotransferase MtaB
MDIVHFETLGCKLNQIETESLAHAFTEAGFTVALGRETAGDDDDAEPGPLTFRPVETPELCVVNTCTVTGKAEQKARRLIRLLLRKHPNTPVLVTGCYAEVEAEAIGAIDPRVCVFPGTRKGELVNLPAWLAARRVVHPEEPLRSALAAFIGGDAKASGNDEIPTPSTFALSTDDFLFHSRASIKIEDGCNNHCSYCRIRLARGKAVSLDSLEVVDRIRKIEEAGWGEVVLTGVNLSQYRSSDGDFADLLERILRETNRIAIRISSLYPERVNDAILPSLANERIRPHFHLSVQSGSDRILSLMRRPYDAQTVYRAAERLRSVKDDPFLACDIITGFPGETDEDFALTLKLCTDIGFVWIHAFPFSARPGTEAWNMRPKVPERIAGERVAILTELAERNHAAYRARWEGRPIPAIVERGYDGGPATVLTANYLAAKLDSAEAARDFEALRGKEIFVILTGKQARPV